MSPPVVIESGIFDNACLFNCHDQFADSSTFSADSKWKSDGSKSDLGERLVLSTMKERAARINTMTCQPGDEDPFYVADLGDVYRQYVRWIENLPRVRPYYAVKCNPDKLVIGLLARLGIGFDCASKNEVELALSTGIDPSRIIYAQPCKTPSFLRYATEKGVLQMTFDNIDELHKIKDVCPDAQLFLRIFTDDSAAACRLSVKFGAALSATSFLLKTAHELGLNVVGVSFHVGSGAADPGAYLEAIQDARKVFDEARAIGFQMKILDIGGGFSAETFDRFGKLISQALDTYFAPEVEVIAEPGRYFVASAFTLAVNVIARRDPSPGMEHAEKGQVMLYLNDGVYGNFSNIIFDHQMPVPRVLITRETEATPTEYSLWGPTCDGIDIVNKSVTLPVRISVGDWLYFKDMGAYTACSRTKFNGFADNHEVIYISSEPINLGGGISRFIS